MSIGTELTAMMRRTFNKYLVVKPSFTFVLLTTTKLIQRNSKPEREKSWAEKTIRRNDSAG